MDNSENPSLLHHNGIKQESPNKPFSASATTAAGGGDRLKRDEWSEGAVSCLLEAYETKWILRNRAKLKGQDWEDVAHYVSSRANSTKSPKTQTQCKNKIESMKKRYRSESAAADSSSWPLYSRLDLLLRGSAPPLVSVPIPTPAPPPPPPLPQHIINPNLLLLEPLPTAVQLSSAPPPLQQQPQLLHQVAPPPLGTAQNSNGSNGDDRVAKEDGLGTKVSDQLSDKNLLETDSSTPALYSDKDKLKLKNLKMKMEKRKKKRRTEEWMIADSIRWLAEVVVRSEQARMDTMRELERMRAEAEAKRGEVDLKRTEIIANTQLEIAKLFAGINKSVDSSLRIGRS